MSFIIYFLTWSAVTFGHTLSHPYAYSYLVFKRLLLHHTSPDILSVSCIATWNADVYDYKIPRCTRIRPFSLLPLYHISADRFFPSLTKRKNFLRRHCHTDSPGGSCCLLCHSLPAYSGSFCWRIDFLCRCYTEFCITRTMPKKKLCRINPKYV